MIPGSGGNNRGTSRLSPGFLGLDGTPFDEYQGTTFTRLTGGLFTYANNLTYFNRTDDLGMPRLSTDYTGAVARREGVLMGPYGDGFTETNTSIDFTGFAGGFWDSENNADHFGARQYSKAQGHWFTPDPAGLAAVDPTNPQTWNRYAYVTNNPTGLVDPLGMADTKPGFLGGMCYTCLYAATGGAAYSQWAINLIASQLASGAAVICPQCDPGTPGGPAIAGMDNVIYSLAVDFFRKDCSGPVSGGVAGAFGNCTTTFVGTGIVPVGTLTDIWYPLGVTPGIPNPSQGYYPEQHTATPTAIVSAVNPPSAGTVNALCIIQALNANSGFGTPTPYVQAQIPDSSQVNVAIEMSGNRGPRVFNPAGVDANEEAENMAAPPGLYVWAAYNSCASVFGY